MIKAWMDECAARLQPLVDQYELIQQQTFAIEKFRDLIVTTRSCPGAKNILKFFFQLHIILSNLGLKSTVVNRKLEGCLKLQ